LGGPERVGKFVDESLAQKKKIVGFGHRIYKTFDPRARLCKQYFAEMVRRDGGDERVFMICDTLEKEMWERKKLPANLDFYAAPIFHHLGIEVPLFTPIFAASRVFGWMAHYDEQVSEAKLIRPDATYVGPTDLRYTPVENRK